MTVDQPTIVMVDDELSMRSALNDLFESVGLRSIQFLTGKVCSMMSTHHQRATDMAQAQLRHGRNERFRRLARHIAIKARERAGDAAEG